VIGENNPCALFGFEHDVVVLAFAASVFSSLVVKAPRLHRGFRSMDGKPARHPKMHHQRLSGIEIQQEIFRPAANAGDATAG
jgi:hypothetical protein